MSDADAVAHHPAGSLLLAVEFINRSRSDERTLALSNVVGLEPGYCVLFVGTLLVVVRHKHSNHAGALLCLIGDVDANGLPLADATVGIASLNGVGDIDVRRCLLNEITVDDLVDIGNVGIVFDDLHARLPGHRGIVPAERHLARALRVLVDEVADGLAVGCCLVLDIGAGGEGCCNAATYTTEDEEFM